MTVSSLTKTLSHILGAAFLLFSGLIFAAGTVEFVSGDAVIQRGTQDLPATSGMKVVSGDSLVTGENGRMRILMEDGERINLYPDTKFVIDQFSLPVSPDRPETGKSFYTFVKGAFDSVVTSLGRRDTTSYRVKTPTATMGIRGTAYTMLWSPEGLYVKVTEGSVTLTNAAGTLTLTAGQIGFVGLGGVAPVLVTSMPAIGAGVGAAAAGTGIGTGVAIPLAILGGLAIIAGSDGGSSGSTTTVP